MDYRIYVTKNAQEDIDRFTGYLINEKKSLQAADNLLNDFDATIDALRLVAGSLKYCSNPKLMQLGYRRINFLNHRYFMLYRIDGDRVIIESIFHELQDYESKLI